MEKFFLVLLIVAIVIFTGLILYMAFIGIIALIKRPKKINIAGEEPDFDDDEDDDDFENLIEEDTPVEEAKVIVKDNKTYSKKNVTVLFYNNIGTPKIVLRDYKAGELADTFELDLVDFNFEHGLITNIIGLAERIHNLIPNISNLDVVLNVSECFRSIESLPKMSLMKARTLYEKELKNDFPNYRDNYQTYRSYFTHSLGVIFSTYFISNETIKYFNKLAKCLNAHLNSVDLWGNFLFNNFKKRLKDDYVLIYVNDDFATILNSSKGNLLTFSSFECHNKEEIKANFISKITRHEFELSKSKLTNYVYISNQDYDISDITGNLFRINCEIDFEHYNYTGK